MALFSTPSPCCPTCIGYPHAQQSEPFFSREDAEVDAIDSTDESNVTKNIYEKEIDPPIFHGLPPDEQ